ncbi:MAG: acetyl-CoA decarbonylase/synthase complex subunit delta [Synergistaceae bacterium]|jgi:acetyl-CoA decarbonylase/synthase complex subunit delta|nr:acetyl-CoA decarbonylase/synthase complex subunit delta [Synergistaceae bacterium]
MPYLLEKSSSSISTATLGATAENGGTRGYTLAIGGENSLPFQNYEGAAPNRAIVAAEIIDMEPSLWPAALKEAWGDALKDPAVWAKRAIEAGADMIYVKLLSIDPDNGGRSVEDCAATLGAILKAVPCPIGVQGCGVDELDKGLISRVAEEFAGENLLIGLAGQENYATVTAACMVHKHTLISSSPLDINICKQINIMISEMNMPMDRIVIDPSIGGLGYGLEYSYSVMERGRIGSLQGDKMLAMPVIGFIGNEAWKAKEANASEADFPKWGDATERGVMWETITATSLLQAGIDILVMRHPEAIKIVKAQIEALSKPVAIA